MKAILFANRSGEILSPLTKRTSVALLPIAAKPTITYALDALLTTPIREVIIIISPYGGKIEHLLGDGTHWNMHFTYALTRGPENLITVLGRLGLKSDEYLLLRGDILYDVNVNQFLTDAQALVTKESVYLTINGQFTGVCLTTLEQNRLEDIQKLNWHVPTWQNFSQLYPEAKMIEQKGKLSLLTSLEDFHQTNLDILADQYPNLVLPGWLAHSQLLVGRRSFVHPDNHGIVAAYCRIHNKAKLRNAIVCDEVIIDSDAHIYNTVILPHTYVGKSVELNNAIAWGNMLIRVDSNTIIENIDSFLLADLNHSTLRVFLTNYFYRFLGTVVFVISLPLWPLAFLSALIENPRHPLRTVIVTSNVIDLDEKGNTYHLPISIREWATSIPLLRHLPKLFAVMSGKIRFIGVSLETIEQTKLRVQPYEKIRDDTPVGLLSPSQIGLPADATVEERLLVEAYYARTRSLGKDLFWLIRGFLCLFTKRAWWSSK